MTIRVAKVPGAKWRLVDWYVAHLPARRVYIEPFFGSGAVLFTKPRSPTEVVSDLDGRVVALFRVLRDRPADLERAVRLTPWSREEWEECRRGRLDAEAVDDAVDDLDAEAVDDAVDDLEQARRFLVESWQSHGLRSLSRSGWRHDALAVERAGEIVGVAIVGRPVARGLQDGRTAEVTRVCVLDGARNACSMLYGAAWRAARALGYLRLVTYTLPEESGASLRGAGWRLLGQAGGGSWSRPTRPREDKHPMQVKLRWEVTATDVGWALDERHIAEAAREVSRG